MRKDVTADFLGRGIFTEDDAFWRTQRHLAKPAFENQRLEDMLPVFLEHGRVMVDILRKAARSGQPVELEDLFMRCVTSAESVRCRFAALTWCPMLAERAQSTWAGSRWTRAERCCSITRSARCTATSPSKRPLTTCSTP